MGTPAERLGGLVRDRRETLGFYTVVDAAGRAGLSRETWAKIERGAPVAPATYRKVEDLLQWVAGSCRAILAGGEPTPVEPRLTASDLGVESPEPNNPYTDPEERLLWALTTFSEGERRAWIELLRERRRATG